MAKTHSPYAPEYRRQMVELVRSGRTPGELAGSSSVPASAIRNWVRQADRDEGRREDGLTSSELEELRRLRRRIASFAEEREILKKAAVWFARETGSVPGRSSAREGEPGLSSGGHDVPGAGCLLQRVLHVAKPWAFQSCEARRGVGGHDPGHPRGIWRHLRGASDACRVDGQRASGEPQTGSSSDARGGLAGVSRRRGTRTTRVDQSHRAVPDRVERQFQADGPDRIWWPTSPTCRPGRGSCT